MGTYLYEELSLKQKQSLQKGNVSMTGLEPAISQGFLYPHLHIKSISKALPSTKFQSTF